MDDIEGLRRDLEVFQKIDVDLRKINNNFDAVMDMLIEYGILPEDYDATRHEYRMSIDRHVSELAENLKVLNNNLNEMRKCMRANPAAMEKNMRDFLEVANERKKDIEEIRRRLTALAEALGVKEEVTKS